MRPAWRYDEAAFVDLARRLEKPGRFLHSQNVAVRAEELARIWGEKPQCSAGLRASSTTCAKISRRSSSFPG